MLLENVQVDECVELTTFESDLCEGLGFSVKG